jgi:hypothetical protein
MKRTLEQRKMKLTRKGLTPLDRMFTGGPIRYTLGSTKPFKPKEPLDEATLAAWEEGVPARRAKLDEDAPAPRGGKLFSELLREYRKDREGEPPIEPDDQLT